MKPVVGLNQTKHYESWLVIGRWVGGRVEGCVCVGGYLG